MKHRLYPVAVAALPLVAAQGQTADDIGVGDILVYVLIGAVVGIIARVLVPGTGGMSWVLTLVLGIIGAVVGGYLWRAIFGDTAGPEWIGSILLAALLVWLVTRMGVYGRGPNRRAL